MIGRTAKPLSTIPRWSAGCWGVGRREGRPRPGYMILNNTLASLPADGRFHYTGYGKGVMFWETDAQAAQFVNQFQDVTAADTYWFTDPFISSGSEGGALLNNGNPLTVAQTRLAANYGYNIDRMRALDAMDGRRKIKAAVWRGIIAGAQGIIYFNHSFGGPDQTQHALRDPAYAAQRAAVDSTMSESFSRPAPVLRACPAGLNPAAARDGETLEAGYEPEDGTRPCVGHIRCSFAEGSSSLQLSCGSCSRNCGARSCEPLGPRSSLISTR